jgi:hypothetical protein
VRRITCGECACNSLEHGRSGDNGGSERRAGYVESRASPGERPVFTADGETYTWADVVQAARLRGEWASLERQTRAGLAAVRRIATGDEEIDRAALEESARRFRYQRRLLAGDEMAAWLDRWGLKVIDLREYLVRAVLRERLRNELDETIARYPVADGDVELAIWGEAVFSGLLERAARTLAGDVALAVGSGELPGDAGRAPLRTILALADQARAAAAREDAIEREIAAHQHEWLRIIGLAAEMESADVAREAALWVRDDGQPLAEAAAAAGSEARAFTVDASEIGDDLASALLAARDGELVGPLARDGRFILYLVTRKEPPSQADPGVRRKAVDRLVARAIERAMASHVEWHEHL